MLQNIRDNSQGVIAKIIVGFIIVVFSLFGVESIVSLANSADAPVVVNGQEITERDIANRVELQKNRLRQQFGEQFNENMFGEGFLRQSAVEQLIEQRVAISQAQELGGFISNSAIDKLILETPDFQLDGKFNADQFKSVLRRNGMSPLGYRQVMTQELLANQVRIAMGYSDTALPFEADRVATLAKEARDYQYVIFKAADLNAEVAIEAAEIESYFAENSSQFMTEEKVSLDYVVLASEAVADDMEVDQEQVQSAYNDYVAQQKEKEQRQASHVLIEINDEVTEADALKLAEEVYAKSQTEDFAKLAQEYSADEGSKTSGGDLGLAGRGSYVTEFEDALYALKQDQVSQPVLTEFGYHIIKLTGVSGAELKTLVEKQAELEQQVRQATARQAFVENAEQLAQSAFESETIEELAEAASLTLQSTELFTRRMGGIDNSQALRDAAFSTEVLSDGEISAVIELSDGKVAVVAIKEHKQPEVKALADVKSSIELRLSSQKATELAQQKADKVLAGEMDAQWQTIKQATFADAKGAPAQVNQSAFSLAKQAEQKQLVTLPEGVAVVKLLEVVDAEQTTADQVETESLSRDKARNSFVTYQKWARANADVVKNI